jgi:hypothetical protein
VVASRALEQRVLPGALAADRTLTVHPALHRLFPQGLTRGSSIVCAGAAAVSTAFVLTSAASQAGAWVGVAGLPAFGAQACREMGTVLERVVVVRDGGGGDRGRDGDESWGPVLGALVDGFELVVFGAAHRLRPATARRVQARLQTRGSVLVLVGDAGPFAADARVLTEATWGGLGAGNGYLRERTVDVTVEGRRIPRPRHDRLAMPGAGGRIESLHDLTVPTELADVTQPAGALARTG